MDAKYRKLYHYLNELGFFRDRYKKKEESVLNNEEGFYLKYFKSSN